MSEASRSHAQQASYEDESNFIRDEDTLEVVEVGDQEGDAESESDDDALSADENAEDEQMIQFEDMADVHYLDHCDSVYCVSVSPSEPIAVSGDGDDSFAVWSLIDGTQLFSKKAHTDTVIAASFNFNGDYFATASLDKLVKVWRRKDFSLVHTLEGPSDDLEWMVWHPKGNALAVGSADATSWLYDAIKGTCLHVFAGHEDSVSCGSFSGNGKLLVTSGTDASTRIWSPKTGGCTFVFQGSDWHRAGIVSQSCHPSAPLVITGGEDGSMRIGNYQTQRVLAHVSFVDPAAAIAAASSEPPHPHDDDVDSEEDEQYQTSRAEDEAGEELGGASVEDVAFWPAMQWAAGAASNGKVVIYDMSHATVRHSIDVPDSVIRIRWHPQLPLIFIACADGFVRLIDARNGHIVREYTGHMDMVLDMCITQFSENQELQTNNASSDSKATPARRGGSVKIVTAGDDRICRVFSM